MLTNILDRALVKDFKKETIVKFYVKNVVFSIGWLHNFQNKFFTLSFLTNVLKSFVSISIVYINSLQKTHWIEEVILVSPTLYPTICSTQSSNMIMVELLGINQHVKGSPRVHVEQFSNASSCYLHLNLLSDHLSNISILTIKTLSKVSILILNY